MRTGPILLPLLLGAAPAFAQAAPAQHQQLAQVDRVLADPATADKLVNVVQAVSQTFLDMPAGQVQAMIEGRTATAADRQATVRDVIRRDDPNFDRNFQRRIAQAKPIIRQGMAAVSQTLPALMQSLDQAEQALKRAAANMPNPNYPVR